MGVHRFDIATLAATPWKNGGGSTREVACVPAGANLDRFDWRVSVATIDRPGPFSVFAGIDRVIMLLDGAGVHLRSPDGRIDHRLAQPHAPFAFSGDAAIDCELLGGTSTDFNLMTRRGRVRADWQLLREATAIAPARSGLLLALAGRWRLGDAIECAPGQGLWWDGVPQAWQAHPQEADAALIAVRLDKTEGAHP
jgi:environmental stress-induced protein Ves